MAQVIDEFIDDYKRGQAKNDIIDFIYRYIDPDYIVKDDLSELSMRKLKQLLAETMNASYAKQQALMSHQVQWVYYQQLCFLKAVDDAWVEQVDNLELLKTLTKSRSVAQRNPLFEYQDEAGQAYRKMAKNMHLNAIQYLINPEVNYQKDDTVDVRFP